jgi:hypothetical protein
MSEDHFVELLNQAFRPQLEAITGMLIGQQAALMALIAKLAQREILTLEDSKTAIAGALSLLDEAQAASTQGVALRQILLGIDALQGQTPRQH